MKEKKIHRIGILTALLLSGLLSSSCSSDDSTTHTTPDSQPVALQVSSVISGLTRASGTSWESADQIGVFTTLNGQKAATQHGSAYDANVLYVIDATADGYSTATNGLLANAKGFTPGASPIYLPANGLSVDVYAYHPYLSSVTESGTISVDVATASQSTAAVDLMTATKESTDETPIDALHPSAALLFSHRLSKVTVNVKAGTGYSDSELTGNVSVVINGTPNTANYNLYTSQFISFGAAADITMQKQATATTGYLETHEAIILPNETGNAAAAGRKLTFKVGNTANGYYIYTIPADKVFEQGKNTIYNITLSPTGLSVTAAIKAWDTIPVDEVLK